MYDWIAKNAKHLGNIPISNDEGDPLVRKIGVSHRHITTTLQVGWADILEWRADARYPAMAAAEISGNMRF
jgi:hypothetical protein